MGAGQNRVVSSAAVWLALWLVCVSVYCPPSEAQTAGRYDVIMAGPSIQAPEPASLALVGGGLAGVGVGGLRLLSIRDRRRFRQQLAAQNDGSLVMVGSGGESFAQWINEQLYLVTKRAIDITLSLLALAVLLPLFVILAIAIFIDSPGPVFYRQARLGQGRRPFKLIKFRSMCTNADEVLRRNEALRKEFEELYKLKNDPRITRLGAFLRKTSLDELPQFINVLLGDISLVGPRPIVEKEVEKYWPFEDRLFSVRPGVTGLWQVSGRNDTTYEERVRLDMRYIAERSLWMDARILIGTVPALLGRGTGAY